MKEWAESFYKGTAWKRARLAYLTERNFICERCGRMAEMVHHRTHLTEDTIDDPDITLGFDNFEALCDTCHQLEHHKADATRQGLCFNAAGDLIAEK